MVFRERSGGPGGSTATDIAAISSLDDPVRAAVLEYVSRSAGEVTRDQAAEELGVTRRIAAFHLDRLAREGWLDVSYRRLSNRTGPGAGRSSKLYRRSGRSIRLSVPPRNYELLARVLAAAVKQPRPARELDEARQAALQFGERIGASSKARASLRASRAQQDSAIRGALTDQGYEPFSDGDVIRMRNCPFHEMARENKDLVCGLNVALMQGLAKGLEVAGFTPVREEIEGLCCVAFHRQG
jgi:predicted ArsR family transcriptional regulator